MPEATTADSLRQRWQGLFEVFQAPPPDPSLFRQRIRFVERNIGIWVKLVLAPVIYWFLFNPNAFGGISVPREDVLSYLRTFTLMMTAVNIGEPRAVQTAGVWRRPSLKGTIVFGAGSRSAGSESRS